MLDIMRLFDAIWNAPYFTFGKWSIMALDTSALVALAAQVDTVTTDVLALAATDTAAAVAATTAADQAAHDAAVATVKAAIDKLAAAAAPAAPVAAPVVVNPAPVA